MTTARAFWVAEPGRGDIREEPIAPLSDGQVLVRARFSGISRGTEAMVFGGRVPESEWVRMRAPFQAGDFPAPVKYGYSMVGVVEAGPAHLVGREVFSLYPHQTRFVVPAEAVHPLPDQLDPARAVLAANMETALNGVWDARPHVGDRITVIGAGTVGALTAWLASRIVGCQVELVDVNPARVDVARALGVGFATPESALRERDAVLHASGSSDGLGLALQVAGDESTVVELSWYGDRAATVKLGEAFHARRLRLISSQVGRVPPDQRARWSTARRLALALDLLRDPALDVVITGESAFDELPQMMARLAHSPGDTLCHRIRY